MFIVCAVLKIISMPMYVYFSRYLIKTFFGSLAYLRIMLINIICECFHIIHQNAINCYISEIFWHVKVPCSWPLHHSKCTPFPQLQSLILSTFIFRSALIKFGLEQKLLWKPIQAMHADPGWSLITACTWANKGVQWTVHTSHICIQDYLQKISARRHQQRAPRF